ncbi:serine protease 27 [Xenopus laevis]|uniref:Serine protease 27 n=1 Tax=Xenopus laevis TaxID=8355 RepID=A0A8J1LU35_XENLA|nr:serine protease 27 [Xenopus laevis]XP_041433057.1 serine protease 27 [Xenopus laevis]OCT59119.1 hypothetical protein XELAEV_18001608mg [Xenopus laevis]
MNWFHLFTALLLLNLGIYGSADEEDNEPICGKPVVARSRILGGRDTMKGKNPWQVIVWLPGKRHCGGTLISSNFVVTVAHCLESSNPTSVIVILGAYKITGNNKEEVPVSLKRIIVHPKYNRTDLTADIALLELARDVPFTNVILPACLPTPSNEFLPGYSCIATGWGDTQFNSTKPRPIILQEVELRLISVQHCRTLYSPEKNGILITDDMICAMDIHGGRDSCTGDGGGPLVCYENERWYLVGVTSFGIGCGKDPGVYTSIPAYVDWIQSFVTAASSGLDE